MNVAVLHAFDKPPQFEHSPDPIGKENETIVHIRAAALKPVDKQMASGSHYAAFHELPVVCGMDGVGCLDDGRRVFFAEPRPPFGSMAQRTVVSPSRCFPIPDNVDDDVAAAVVNPGLSAWGAVAWRAQLTAGETVLILGATGVTGKLALQTAKLLGAGRVDGCSLTGADVLSSGRGIPRGKQESEPPRVFCQGISLWDEPCMIPATKYCERCNRWFCQAHLGDPGWHSCAEERKSRIRTVTT